MSWGGNFINYSLYSDASRSTEWTPTQSVTGTGNGSSRTHTIYGRVFSGQNVSNPGTYGDTIVATVTY
jgi:spore coat protein U-like protein